MTRNRLGTGLASAGRVGRRGFLQRLATVAAGCAALPARATIARQRAHSCIFIVLAGAPSQTDTFDLKEGPWTPAWLHPASFGDLRFPQGLMPKLAARLDSIALLRSFRSWSTSHSVAQEWLQIGRDPMSNPGRRAPHIGSVVAHEFSRRTKTPAFVSLNPEPGPGGGYLAPECEPCFLPSNSFAEDCESARKLVRAGTRFVHIVCRGWDHHSDIYEPGTNLQSAAREFDGGLAGLIDGLRHDHLLDDTLVVAMGEFGRRGGELNREGGRDHHPQQTVLVAGAAIRGPKVIGVTDRLGGEVVEPGWRQNREIRPEDLGATVYSALGIDWTAIRCDDPSGCPFEYVRRADDLRFAPIDELWA
jgi:hypothetical protein